MDNVAAVVAVIAAAVVVVVIVVVLASAASSRLNNFSTTFLKSSTYSCWQVRLATFTLSVMRKRKPHPSHLSSCSCIEHSETDLKHSSGHALSHTI